MTRETDREVFAWAGGAVVALGLMCGVIIGGIVGLG